MRVISVNNYMTDKEKAIWWSGFRNGAFLTVIGLMVLYVAAAFLGLVGP